MNPSLKSILLPLAAGFVLTVAAHAADPAAAAGPNKGKLVGQPPDQAEVLIAADGTLTVTFLDAGQKPIAPGARTVTVFAQLDSGRQPVEMVARDNAFVSAAPLPKPEGYVLVVQTRATAKSKPANSRLTYAMHTCGGCKLPEYACTCTEH